MSLGHDREKIQHINRLKAWRDELKTNAHQMQNYADAAIKKLEEKIKSLWPDVSVEQDGDQ